MENFQRDLAMFASQLPSCWSRCGWSVSTAQVGHVASTFGGHVSGAEGMISTRGVVYYVCAMGDYKRVEQFMLQRCGGFIPSAVSTENLTDGYSNRIIGCKLTVNFAYIGTP